MTKYIKNTNKQKTAIHCHLVDGSQLQNPEIH